MKKLVGVLMIGAAVVLAAGNANAFFADGDLIRVVYSTSGNEVATDLGNLSQILGGTLTIQGDVLGTVTGGNSTGFAVTSTLLGAAATTGVVSYYEQDSSSATTLYEAGTKTPPPVVNTYAPIGGSTNSSISAVSSYYSSAAYTTRERGLYNKAGSATYYTDLGNTSFNGVFTPGGAGSSLAALSTTTPVSLDLWLFNGATGTETDTGLTLNTAIDGSGQIYTTEVLTPLSPTPIPPSVLLFVPGLLGLIGLKRRISA